MRELAIGLRNLMLGGNLASISLLKTPKRWAVYATESLAMLDAFRGARRLPLKNVQEVFGNPDRGSIHVTLSGEMGMWMSTMASRTVDLLSLCMICSLTDPRVVFEIGTWRGHSALHMALNTPEDAAIFTLDLPPEFLSSLSTTAMDRDFIVTHSRTTRYVFAGASVEHKIRCLFGDSAHFDFSPYYDKVDLFFVDGAHSYEYVRSDTINALRCCRPGGVIAWHDFGRRGVNGVTRWLLELSRSMLIQAVRSGSLAYAVVEEPSRVLREIG